MCVQGAEVAELMLTHAKQSECSDVSGFKDELGALVIQARRHALTLARVRHPRIRVCMCAVVTRSD